MTKSRSRSPKPQSDGAEEVPGERVHPIVLVKLLPPYRGIRQFRTEPCPFCSKRHLHGAGSVTEDPRDYVYGRVPHCLGGAKGHYILQLAPDQKLPKRRPTGRPKTSR